MTLQKLLNTIGTIGVRDKLVNFTGCGGSVYELNDLSIHNYPILYCSPTGTHRVEDNYTTYQLSLFYIDRLLEDNSNGVDIHSAAVEVLKQIIRKIQKSDGVIGISDEYSINLFTETEKFKDRCNGAYATVEISVVNDTTCEDEYLDTTFKVYYHTLDGEPLGNLPSNPWGNAVVVSDVSIAPMEYTHIDGQKYIVNGYLTLTDTPTEIPLAYFRGKSNMDAIFLPDTIRKIGLGAFRNCENLTTIGGTASTDNIQVYDNSPFYGTQMSRTFVVGSKCRAIGSNLTLNMGYVEGDELKVNMTYQEFRDKVQRDCSWFFGSPIKNIRFTDTTIVPELTFNEIPDAPWEGGNLNVTFDTNLLYNMRWVLYRAGAMVTAGGWCESQGKSISVPVPANPDREPRDYEIVTYYKNTNEEFVRTGFTQEAKGYYLKITSYPASIDSTYQSVRFYFETDCDDTLRAFLSKSGSPDGPWSGLSTKSIDIGNRSVYFNVDENSGSTKVYYKVDIVGTGTGEPEEQVSDSAVVAQEAADTYFEFTTPTGSAVPSTQTSLVVEYETNLQAPIPYVLRSSKYGTTSGVSNSVSSVAITFPEYTGATGNVQYELMMGGKSLIWYQHQRTYHIDFTSYPSEITAERQLVCFVWDTDIPDDGYLAYWLGSGATREAEPVFVRSGVTHNLNGDCITFSANTGDERYYTLDMYAYLPDGVRPVAVDEIVFKQKGVNDSGSTHQYGYDPLRQITGSPQPNQVFYRSSDGQAIPYGLMAGWATDMNGNDMNATSNVYQNGYGIITFPRAIKTTDCVVENKGKLLEIVWPEGMIFLDNFSSSIITEQPTLESITLPSTLERVTTMAFYNENIQYINLPIGLRRTGIMKALMTNTFNGNVDNLEIYYAGTVAQWNEVKKNTDWLYHKRSGQKVICSDGSVDA